MSNNPRTSPLQAVPSRPAKAKHSLKSKLSAYAIPGYDTIPGYVKSMHPTADVATQKAMVNAVKRHVDATGNIPSVSMCNQFLFKGLI